MAQPGLGEQRAQRLRETCPARSTSDGGSSSVPISNSSGAGSVGASPVGGRGRRLGRLADAEGVPCSSRRWIQSFATSCASSRMPTNARARSVATDRAARVKHVERVRAL